MCFFDIYFFVLILVQIQVLSGLAAAGFASPEVFPWEAGVISRFCLCLIVFITFLMLILCLILLFMTVHAFSHNADRWSKTKGREVLGGAELKMWKYSLPLFFRFFLFSPPAVYLRMSLFEHKIFNLYTHLVSIFSFFFHRERSFSVCYQTIEGYKTPILFCFSYQMRSRIEDLLSFYTESESLHLGKAKGNPVPTELAAFDQTVAI